MAPTSSSSVAVVVAAAAAVAAAALERFARERRKMYRKSWRRAGRRGAVNDVTLLKRRSNARRLRGSVESLGVRDQ